MNASGLSETRPASSCLMRLVLGPALITLGVTLIRLGLELGKAPAWLANRDVGGPGAILGIAWLPAFVGPWFVTRLRTPGMATWPLLKKLVKTLVVYGWSARIPVVAITFLAVALGWDTHYSKFGPDASVEPSMAKIVLGTLAFQLVGWAMIWTPIAGGIAGLLWHSLTRGRTPAVADRSATPA